MAERTQVTREVDQREVHRFSPRIDVVARPVDTFDRSAGLSNSATRLGDALGVAVQAAGAAGQIFELQNIQARKKGAKLAEQGNIDVMPSDSPFSTANITRDVVHRAQGGRDAVQARVELDQLATSAPDIETFQSGVEDLKKKYMGGFIDSPAYLSSFNRPFEAAQAQATIGLNRRFTAEGLKSIQEANEVRVSQLISDQLSGLKTANGTFDIEKLAEATPQMAQMFREDLSALQEELGQPPFNLSKADVSEWFLNQMKAHAVAQGSPELLDFALVPDKDGVRLADRDAGGIFTAQEAARNARDNREARLLRKEVEDRRLKTEDFNAKNLEFLLRWSNAASGDSQSQTELFQIRTDYQNWLNEADGLPQQVGSFDAPRIRQALATFHKMDSIRRTGTPEMTHQANLLIASGDLEGIKEALAAPEDFGWDNIEAMTEVVTDKTQRNNAEHRKALFSSVSIKRQEKLVGAVGDLQKIVGVPLGDDDLQFSAEGAQAARAKLEIETILGTVLENELAAVYHNAVMENQGAPVSPELIRKEYAEIYKSAEDRVDAVLERYRSDAEERKARAGAGERVQERIQAGDAALGEFDTGVQIPSVFTGIVNALTGAQDGGLGDVDTERTREAIEGLNDDRTTIGEAAAEANPENPEAARKSALERFDLMMDFGAGLHVPGSDERKITKEKFSKALQEVESITGDAIGFDEAMRIILDTLKDAPTLEDLEEAGRVPTNQ